jgi:hypothetical protein
MDKQWSEMTKEEKRDHRLKDYLNPPQGIKFVNAKAEKLYKERLTRQLKAQMCEKPDRVPVQVPIGAYPIYHAGLNYHAAMYDYKAAREAWTKFMWEFYDDMDSYGGPGMVLSGKVLDILDYHQYSWPGHGLGKDATTHQFNEKQYISAAEYDVFLENPADFFFRVLTPRTIGAAEPWAHFPHLTNLNGMPLLPAYPFIRADVRESFKKFIAAGEELERQMTEYMPFNMECLAAGFPAMRGGMASAPFDLVADNLRGTSGVAIDMYRCPDKLLEAVNVSADIHIKRTLEQLRASNGVSVTFPLHKGDDKFMSRKAFEKFYWPTLKRFCDALIADGVMVNLFAEGSHNERLDYYADFPKGWVTYLFDRTDMAKAKKALGSNSCIVGNVPASLVITGTPQQVKESCRKLIEDCAPGGGYVLAGGCSATETKNPENFRMFMEAAVEYGTYK